MVRRSALSTNYRLLARLASLHQLGLPDPDTLLPVADVIYTGIVLACTRWHSGQCIVIIDSTLNP